MWTLTLFQLLRVTGAPLVISFLASKYRNSGAELSKKETAPAAEAAREGNIYLTLISGGLSGFVLWYLGVPAGAITSPMISVGVLRCFDLPLKPLSKKVIGLLSRFLSPNHNRRTDEYGGDALDRAHIIFDIYQAIRDELGPDYLIQML